MFKNLIKIWAISLFLITKLFAGIELLRAKPTFYYPLCSKMFDVYYKTYSIKVNYQSISSGV
jgi:phosphate transport system substrate-binding protein